MFKAPLILLLVCLYAAAEQRTCFGVVCEEGTTSCSKQIKTDHDQKTIITTIACRDLNNQILGHPQETSDSSNYSPYTTFQGTSYSGYVHSDGLAPINIQMSNVIS